MPTTVTRTIGTAGRDYSTLQAWEDAAPANLVTADQIWRGEVYKDSEFVVNGTVLTVTGSTSDATRYKELVAATGQGFKDAASPVLRYDATKGAAIRTSNNYARAVDIQESFARIRGLQISANSEPLGASNGSVTDVRFDDLLAYRSGGGAGAVVQARNVVLTNCVAIAATSGVAGISFNYSSAGSGAYNCTAVKLSGAGGGGEAYASATSGIILTNCAAFGYTSEVNTASRFTATTCRTDKASPMTGFSTLPYDTSTGSGFEAITGASHDFRLKSTSALINSGTSTGAPTTDIFGTARPSGAAYDVGAHEYVSAATFKAFWARHSNVLIGAGVMQ